jgi:hypothetical protein
MIEHVASGIEEHTRWSTDWRLAIGAGEIDTPGSQGVDMRCVQGRMAVAAHIISTELSHMMKRMLRTVPMVAQSSQTADFQETKD